MTDELVGKRLEELGESEYKELRSVYYRLREMKEAIDRVHDAYVQEAKPPEFTSVEAIYLMADDVVRQLERYLLAVCDPTGPCMPVE